MKVIETLTEVLARWPQGTSIRVDEAARHLQGFLADDFELSDLAIRPNGRFKVGSHELTRGNESVVIVYDSESPSVPHRARLVRGEDGQWRLSAFTFQCLTCFGSGILDGEPCDTCGATGWGLAKEAQPDEPEVVRVEALDEAGKRLAEAQAAVAEAAGELSRQERMVTLRVFLRGDRPGVMDKGIYESLIRAIIGRQLSHRSPSR